MKVKIISALFSSVLVLATLLLIYQIWNLPSDTQPPHEKKEDILFLQSRMKQLEEDIHSNQDTIKEIKSLIKSLSLFESGGDNAVLDETPFDTKVKHKYDREKTDKYLQLDSPSFNFSKAAIQQDDCIFSTTSPSNVDIQMKNVYESLPFDNPNGGVWKQGWNIEYDSSQWSPENKLKVFVVPHSHNDPGWIKTFEKYFEDQTRHILDNMVVKLMSDHRMKFIWAEISFFSLWWERQPMEVKTNVKKLLETGQLEIVTGGWVMPDEANTHYSSILNQLMTGHEWLRLNLGVKPNNGWANDPFGLSPTMAYILKRSGLQNMVIQRVHYSIKKHLAKIKSLEFRWRQIWDSESSTDMFCHTMPFYSYDVPHTCGPDPKICCQFDFRRLPGAGITCPWRVPPQPINDHNVESRAKLLLDQYRKKAQLYKTNVLLVQLGDDFRYDTSEEWDDQFHNYIKLFDFMNENKGWHVQAQFGTMADYFRTLREEAVKSSKSEENLFPSLSGDFFTYADRDHHYWSGYYTSRPFYKRMDRVLLNYLRSAEILFALMLEKETQSKWNRHREEVSYALMDNLFQARRNHAIFQHHDGVTGTAKNHVVVDYANKMLSALRTSQHVIQQAANSLLSLSSNPPEGDDETSVFFDMEESFAEHNKIAGKNVINVSAKAPRKVYIFNPEAHKRKHIMTIRVNTPYIQVKNRSGDVLLCQVDPVISSEISLRENEFDVHFIVSLDALSLTLYTLHYVDQSEISSRFTSYSEISTKYLSKLQFPKLFKVTQLSNAETTVLHTGVLKAHFNANGLLKKINTGSQSFDATLEFYSYDSNGGAYLFLPKGPARQFPIVNPPQFIVKGPLLSSIKLFQTILHHEVVLKNSPGIDGVSFEINNYVDLKREHNFELVMRISTSIDSGEIFYSDLNGFQVIKRQRYSKLPIQGNFYPMSAQMFIEDKDNRLSILTAQPLGCSSVASGQMEVMMDRQLAQDDERGLGHGVTDNVATLHKFRLVLENKVQSKEYVSKEEIPNGYPSLTSHATSTLILQPSLLLHNVVEDAQLMKHWSIGGELPCDIEIVNLRVVLANRQPGALYPPSRSLALTFRRLAFSCSFSNNGLTCSTNNGKIRIIDLFPSLFHENVKQMSLTHLYDGVDMTKSYSLTLRPMELYSYKLFLSPSKQQ